MTWLTSGLVQPDVVLPLQFFGTVQRQALSKTGEFQLVVAVLEDAIRCFQKYAVARDRIGRRLFRETEQWIMGDGATGRRAKRPALSFRYVCEIVGLDPNGVRRGLRKWHDRAISTAAGRTATAVAKRDESRVNTTSCRAARRVGPSVESIREK